MQNFMNVVKGDRTIDDTPFDVHWNNRLYSPIIVLITIVSHEHVEVFSELIEEGFIPFCINTKMRQLKMADVICANKRPLDGRQIDDDNDDFGDTTFKGKSLESENSSSSLYNYDKKSAPSDGRTLSHLTNKNINDSKNTNVLLQTIIRRADEFVTRATAMGLCGLSMIVAGEPEPFAL